MTPAPLNLDGMRGGRLTCVESGANWEYMPGRWERVGFEPKPESCIPITKPVSLNPQLITDMIELHKINMQQARTIAMLTGKLAAQGDEEPNEKKRTL